MRPDSRTHRCLSNKLLGHTVTTRNAPRFWVLCLAPFTLYNRLQASRAKESDVLPLLQRHAALMRHEPGEKVYEERARGQKSCWTKILKSSPAVAEPSGTRCVEESIQASRHLRVFGRCVTQGERRQQPEEGECCLRHIEQERCLYSLPDAVHFSVRDVASCGKLLVGQDGGQQPQQRLYRV